MIYFFHSYELPHILSQTHPITIEATVRTHPPEPPATDRPPEPSADSEAPPPLPPTEQSDNESQSRQKALSDRLL